MTARWKKVAMIMLVGLLLAGPFAQIHNAAAQGEMTSQALTMARSANDKAASELHQMMMQMDSMSKMPMSDNEKAMMKMIHDLATVVQTLIDVNKQLITAVEHGNK